MQEPTTRIYERLRCIYIWSCGDGERSEWQWTVAMRCGRDWRIAVPATGPLQIVADLKLVDGTLRVLVQCVPGKQLQDDGNSEKSMYHLSVWPAFSNFWRLTLCSILVSGYTFYRRAYPKYECR